MITDRINDLPPLPTVVHHLLTMMGREFHSMHDVVEIVENDLALTTKVLKVANSAAFSRGQAVTSLARAILHLGEKMVVSIAIGSCSPQIFNRPLEGYQSAAGELWDHSLRTAIATREIVQFHRQKISSDLAFTAGLLHDVGKAVLSEFLSGHAEGMAAACDKRESQSFLAAERQLLDTDHAQVGEAMARHWNLPDPLCSAIRHHHQPEDTPAGDQGLVYAVHVGDLLAMMGGAGTGVDALAYRMDPGYTQYLKLEINDLDRLFLIVQEEFADKKASIFTGLEA
jgi:putative nucleotidyltransferase with HDIG domain